MCNSTRQISDCMYEHLGHRVSAETVSAITDRVLPEIQAGKSRMLDAVYPIVWLGWMPFTTKSRMNKDVL